MKYMWWIYLLIVLWVFVVGILLLAEDKKGRGTVETPIANGVGELQYRIIVLENQLEAAELQLGVYEGNIQCVPFDIYTSPDWGGMILVSKTELCGFAIGIADRSWGPSTAAILLEKDRTIEGLRQQVEALQLKLDEANRKLGAR